jgi:hypothetical protein
MAVEPHRGRSLPLRLQEGVSRTRILERRLGEVQSGKTGKQGGRNPQGNAVVPLGPLAVPGMPPRGRIPSGAGLPATPGHGFGAPQFWCPGRSLFEPSRTGANRPSLGVERHAAAPLGDHPHDLGLTGPAPSHADPRPASDNHTLAADRRRLRRPGSLVSMLLAVLGLLPIAMVLDIRWTGHTAAP